MVVLEELAEGQGPPSGGGDGASEALESADRCRREGNELLARGDFADACQRYDAGLLALVRVGAGGAEAAEQARLSLHLNASLAHLRRGNLGSAVEHATGALAIDACSVKALYRRGSARARLAEHPGHEGEAVQARRDLERALELEPGNAEVRSQLKQLRSTARAEQKELDKSQRDTFRNIFSGGKAIYEERPKVEPPPVLRSVGGEGHEVVLSAEQVEFYYDRSEELLKELDLELRSGWCVGLFGSNACGKSTLARLLDGRLAPVSGKVVHHSKGPPQSVTPLAGGAVLGAVLAAAAAALLGEQRLQQPPVLAALLVACLLATLLAWAALRWRRARAGRFSVRLVSSESSDKESIPGGWKIERVIGENLPRGLAPAQRRERVVAMLCAAGFQMYNQDTGEAVGTPAEYIRDGLAYGSLSGGQKHLMYILRNFAACPDVLICDELLGGLDAFRQPRVLHMLKRLQREAGVAVLYISTELHQQRMVADSIAFMSGGRIAEHGSLDEVFDFPRHPGAKEYLSNYRGLPGCQKIGGKLGENFVALEGDEALSAPWLPRTPGQAA
ncbi:unnamed protein product [Prorocentrum cordatum]|uniref:ABC transporter domain-containing protein n=1 Tax=Prorocentrum cordatum TaxID=2364126 RepID=A0ABN9VQV0_9DINO|nr:unnamed protein product [Polarella glacialis]